MTTELNYDSMIEVKREAKPGQGGIIMHGVTISELIKKMKLKNTTPEIDTDKIVPLLYQLSYGTIVSCLRLQR